jgi:hypothetical protein
MDQLALLQVAVGKRCVDQEGFPDSWLSQEERAGLTRVEALPQRLHSRRITSTRKEPGGMRRLRERIVLQGIILEHHGDEATFSS